MYGLRTDERGFMDFFRCSSHGWVQACANGRVGGMGGFIHGYGWFYGMGAEIVSSIVMYNFGVGPRGDPLFTAF